MDRVVIINSYKEIKEALIAKGTDFAGRPTTSIIAGIASRGFQGLSHSDYSKQWAFLRKLAYKSLHLYGSGMKNIEEIVVEEVEKMCSILSEESGKPIKISRFLGN